ncbi:Dual-action HEIGH metallo-peptidase [Ekhidna lutea]|uniref:Dual-action HEIGH metallo-peptidase n=1 Tax=Ekhidna lutea TaxID=447679 RepID=A0A239LL06_EKHLU|nr:M57 family metalloprotease [Ekhidna lutea]SNT31246.1 Dual-action HEIGH metallo-peptidase [Ekhidna lutea]
MRRFNQLGILALSLVMLWSCQENETQRPELEEVPQEVLEKVAVLGFNADEVKMYDGNLFIEGDIRISLDQLDRMSPSEGLPVEEHYHTDNLVTGTPRTINVFVNMPQKYKDATDIAIDRYNNESLNLTFNRVSSSGQADITIKASPWYYYWFGILGSAGFPENGDPYGTILMTRGYYDNVSNINGLATTIAHEMGHCIGFRHTDYMDRSYSCGGAPDNEGDGGVGANHIPGTPTGPSANSWMLACGSPEGDRPFTADDKTALGYVY